MFQNSAAQLVLFVLGLIGTAVLLTSTAVGSSMQSTINSSMVNIILYYPVHDWANFKLSQIQESVRVQQIHNWYLGQTLLVIRFTCLLKFNKKGDWNSVLVFTSNIWVFFDIFCSVLWLKQQVNSQDFKMLDVTKFVWLKDMEMCVDSNENYHLTLKVVRRKKLSLQEQ